MNKNRFAKPVVVVAGFILLCALSGAANTQSAAPSAVQAPKAVSPAVQQKIDVLPPDDFSGLNYTEEQKTEIDKIHRDTESQKAVVAKDDNLTTDQKDAMLLGYTRMEYGRMYRVLSPVQQRQVRQRIAARRSANQAARQKQPGTVQSRTSAP
jgi:Spy/CpxP family protein refolding chaperone